MDEVINSRLSSLSRELSQSAKQCSPERHIKQALVAHGYFQHSVSCPNGKKSSANSQSSTRAPTTQSTSLQREKLAGGITEEDKKKTTQLISHYKGGREVYKLKEPRNLFAKLHPVPNMQTRKRMPLWPKEVECVPIAHKLLRTPPPFMEPFQEKTLDVTSPKIRSTERGGTTVYSNPRGPEKYFKTSRLGPSREFKSSARSPEDITLIFESRFESGNLGKAVQVGKWDYELYLSFDLYTKKHTQWFYFSVRNMREEQTYRFTIVNLYKAGSLYNMGMQPVFYSTVEATNSGVGWTRRGSNIKYFKTPIKRSDTKGEAYYFGLTWSHTFEHANDTCYFAHCYPYTYSDLQEDLQTIANNPVKSKFCKTRTLCQSLAGNPVPILTITSPVRSLEERDTKRAVVVTSRVHPGETNSSWMMKGLMDYLTGDSPDAKTLRDSFIFKVVPMLNPDGVIVGNYRCSLTGRDLNRNYRTGYQDSYPVLWHVKNMIRTLAREREIVLYCDLHGHSRKQNVFIYGCDDVRDKANRFKSRIFPKMLSKNIPCMFSYSSSKFGIHKSKEGTGRVVMWKEMGIINSYTMEATFCGSLLGKMAHYQFRTVELQQMGYQLCDTLLDYCDPDQSKVRCIMLEIEQEYREAVLAHLALMGQTLPPDTDLLDISISSMDSSSDIGSDSSESDGPPMNILAKERKKKKKKKKLKSRRERNKQKAIIKMSHSVKLAGLHPPVSAAAGQVQVLNGPTSATSSFVHPSNNGPYSQTYSEVTLSSGLEGAKNGGIPMFVQERIGERQKRKSGSESADRQAAEDMKQMESIAQEYLKQGFCAPLHLIDPRSSCNPLLQQRQQHSETPNQGYLPITISSMSLMEGNCKTSKQPSRSSSRALLPQLKEQPSMTSGIGFTSQYMANHLQRMALNPLHQDSSPSLTPPTNNTDISNTRVNSNIPSNDDAGSVLSHSSNAVDFGDLSFLLNKIRPNLVGKDTRPQVNYRGQKYPPQQRPETRSRASRVPTAVPNRNGQQTIQRQDHAPKVNRIQMHNFNSSSRPVGSIDGEPANSRPHVADWAMQENALTRASREDCAWPLPVKQLSDPKNLFPPSHPPAPLPAQWQELGTGSSSSGPLDQPHPSSFQTSSGSGVGQGMQVTSFSSNSGNLLARTRPQLPHTLAPINSSTDSIKQSIAEVVKLNSHFHLPEESTSTTSKVNNGSILEHKRHLTKAVHDRRGRGRDNNLQAVPSNSFLNIDLGKQTFCQPVLSSAGPAELANPALHEHTHFMAEPHPLVVAKDGHCGVAVEKSVKGRQKREVDPKEKENSMEFIKKAPHIKGLAAANAKDWDYLDEDPEYYTELEENLGINKKKQLPTSVRRHAPKPPNTSSGTRGRQADVANDNGNSELLSRAGLQDLVRPSTNYLAQRPRPLRLKTKSAATKKLLNINSGSRYSEIR